MTNKATFPLGQFIELVLEGRKTGIMTLLVCLVLFLTGPAQATTLRFLETIPLPGIEGRIDHLSIDREGRRLFIAALGNNSLEVFDLRRGVRIMSISGLSEPQGVFYDSECRKIYVSNGGDGTLRIYDAVSFRPAGAVSFSGDADNLQFEERTKYLYVGYDTGALGIVDTRTKERVGDIKLAGHPEGFSLEKSGSRIFVNVPAEKRIVVVDRVKQTNVAEWPVACADNFPMALDEARHRLFIGCRVPPKILIYDTETGNKTADLSIGRDVDDLFFDASQKRLYASCGVGSVFVFAQSKPDRYRRIAAVKTQAGARTSLFVPELHRFYVAVPRNGKTPAGIMVYEVGQ